MKIKFVQNFRGRETNERYFAIGEVADLDTGADLVKRGIAEEVKPPAPKKTRTRKPAAQKAEAK